MADSTQAGSHVTVLVTWAFSWPRHYEPTAYRACRGYQLEFLPRWELKSRGLRRAR